MATIYTSVGEAQVTDFTTGDASAPANYYIAWGTGAGTAAKGDTTLFVEASEARVIGAETQPAADKAQWVGTLTADGAKTITNAGLFDASTVGNLFVKGDFTGVVLALGDKIEFTITLEQT